jgi:transcriptional regulator with XRE-family HTH domain
MEVWKKMREIVKEKSEKQGIRQGFIADQCNVSAKELSLIINGRKPITDTIIQKFCAGTGVSPNDLFGEIPRRNSG